MSRYQAYLEEIWASQILTNFGPLHETLEGSLIDYLSLPPATLSLCSSGTMALLLACRGLRVTGDVVTTPFTFPATTNVLEFCGARPVFADIDPATLVIDPAAVERALTPQTSAILAVHVYGMPCDVHALAAIASARGIRLIFDAAHALLTKVGGRSLLEFGDASIVSFHATKLFHTGEGGAVITPHRDLHREINLLRNFGISDETTIEAAGINGKMTEFQAALGLALLPLVETERVSRSRIADIYRSRFAGIRGISCLPIPESVQQGFQYFPIRIDTVESKLDRDQVYEQLKEFNVNSRRYFFPLCSTFPFSRKLSSSAPENLPNAYRAASEVLCLPFYGDLGEDGARRIADMIEYLLTS